MATNGNHSEETKNDGQKGVMIGQEVVPVLTDMTMASALAKAELDQQIVTAKQYPRSIQQVTEAMIELATLSDDVAASCIYSLPRAGKAIVGPSVRLAEIISQTWGNAVVDAVIIGIDRVNKQITAAGSFHDLQTNVRTRTSVSRRISDKNGRLFNDDMIAVTGNAACAIARRNATLAGVPKGVWSRAYDAAHDTTAGTIMTLKENRKKAFDALAKFKVKPEQVFGLLGVKGELDIGLDELVMMRGMYSALNDGTETVESMFDPRRMTGTGFEKVDNPLGDDTTAPPAPVETVDPKTGEIKTEPTPTAAAADEKKPRGRPAKTGTPPPAGASLQVNPPLKEQGEAPAPALEPTQGPKPKNAAEYKAYMELWLAGYTTVAQIEDRWRQDRGLRGECSVVEETFAALRTIKEARVAQLQSGK